MPGVEAILGVLAVTQNVPAPLPSGIVDALGATVVVTQELLEFMRLSEVAYTITGYKSSVVTPITGAIVDGREQNSLIRQFMEIAFQSGWRTKALVVIIGDRPDILVFDEFFSRKTPNTIYHTPDGDFAYNPFTKEVFPVNGTGNVERVLRKRWNNMKGFPVILDIYRHNLGYLEGFKVKLGAGIDASALYELSKLWNMTPNFYNPTGVERIFEPELADNNLMTGITELNMNARFMTKSSEHLHLEYASTVYADSIVIVLIMPGKLRGWDVFVKIFGWEVWLSLLITIIVLNRFLRVSSGEKDGRHTMVLTLRSFFAIPVKKHPVLTRERWAVACVLLMSTVIINTYTANLYNIIQSGRTFRTPETLKEVTSLGVPVMATTKGLDEHFEMRQVEVRRLARDIQLTRNISDSLLQHNAYIMSEREMRLLMDSGRIRRDIHFVNEKVMSFTMAYVVKWGSPYLEPLSDYTARVFEAGLHEWWYRCTVGLASDYYGQRRRKSSLPEQLNQDSSKILTVYDLEIAFFCLFLGLGISMAVFLCELFVKHVTKTNFRYTRWFLDRFVEVCS